MSEWNLNGRVAFITGAARGIGAESARRAAANGMKVALVGLEPEELEKVAQSLPTEAITIECDVTDRAQIDAAVAQTVERFGGIDFCMANAGIVGAGPLRHSDPEGWERVLEINVFGVTRTVQACLPHLIERKGYVLMVASLAAIIHGPGMANYAASKAAVDAFAGSLRNEIRHLGVDVGCCYFGFIDTDLVRGGDEHPVFATVRGNMPGFLSKAYPLSQVGDAIESGLRKRAKMIVVPRWVKTAMLMRGFLLKAAEPQLRKEGPEIDRVFEEAVAREGREASSKAVGIGGRAADG